MEQLNARNLRMALGFAAEHDHTSIAIVLDCMSSVVAMRRSIENQYLNMYECISTRDSITFPNGSIIRLHTLNNEWNNRGYRSNIVLVHSLIANQHTLERIRTIENPQHGHPGIVYQYIGGIERYCELIVEHVSFEPTNKSDAVQDFGSFEPSSEILDYIGGLYG